jgi:transcriptional regulator with XRE-family HTH domain
MAQKSKFEIAVIDRVKAMRVKRDFTQDDLAYFLNTSRGFIGQVESPNSKSKYNLNHLNTLAAEMNCSPKDFMPEKPVSENSKSKGR